MHVRTISAVLIHGVVALTSASALAQDGGGPYYAGTFSLMHIASGAQPQGGVLIVGWDNFRCGFAESILEQNASVGYTVTQSQGGFIRRTTTFAQGWGLGPSNPSYRDTIEMGGVDEIIDLDVETSFLRAEHGPTVGVLARTHGGTNQHTDSQTNVPPPQPPTPIDFDHSEEHSAPGVHEFPTTFLLFAEVHIITVATLTPAGGTPLVFPVNEIGGLAQFTGDLETGEFTRETFQFASDFDSALIEATIDEFGNISMTGVGVTTDEFFLGAGDSLTLTTFMFARLYVELGGCIPSPSSAALVVIAGAIATRRRRP